MKDETFVDPEVLANLMIGLYTCYWCGDVFDIKHDDHVDRCLREVNWLRKHVEMAQ